MKDTPANLSVRAGRSVEFGNCRLAFCCGTRALLFFAAVLAAGAAAARADVLTLENAIRLALENNRSIKVDNFSRAIARANLLASYGAFEPAIGFGRSYNQTYSASFATTDTGFLPVSTFLQADNYNASFGGLTPWGLQYSLGGTATNQRGPYNGFTNNFLTFAGVQVRQPLLRGFGFGANLLGVRVARADRRISEWQYRQTVIDTVTNVTVAYSNLVAAHEVLRIARKSRDLAAGLLAENQRRAQVGSMSENDVTSARARTALREEAILFATQAVRDSDNQLRLLMGEAAFGVDGPFLEVAAPAAPDIVARPAEDLKQAYELRPDYQQARLGMDKSRYNAAAARNQMLPQVDFVGSYGYTGLDQDFAESRRLVADRDHRAFSAGVTVSIPLTLMQGRGQARAAKLQYRQAEANVKQLEESIAMTIASAAGQIDTTAKRVAAASAAVALTQQSLDEEIKKLRAGVSSTFNVLYIQDQLAGAENSYIQAQADQRRAAAAYERETGTTLQRNQITLSER